MAGPQARSTQNRWSIVQTEPCSAISATTGIAAASASHAHGQWRVRSLGADDPGGHHADREQHREVGA